MGVARDRVFILEATEVENGWDITAGVGPDMAVGAEGESSVCEFSPVSSSGVGLFPVERGADGSEEAGIGRSLRGLV